MGLGGAAIGQWLPFQVQFARQIVGQSVQVCLDGWKVENTFAGKLGFRTRTASGLSVCANVRGPVSRGQKFVVQPQRSGKVGGNLALAGSIVASCFVLAQSPDQCAGLQIAVWEAIEDGGASPDFGNGRFRVRANAGALAYAAQFYQASRRPGDALFLNTLGGPGQSQLAVLKP
jgi:hypothetical protein